VTETSSPPVMFVGVQANTPEVVVRLGGDSSQGGTTVADLVHVCCCIGKFVVTEFDFQDRGVLLHFHIWCNLYQ
jgi:hypothetical protein